MTQLTELAELKAAVADALGSLLDKIDWERREPDPWERAHLVTAISLLFRGAYSLAALQAMNAATAPERRSPEAQLSDVSPYGLEVLRQALAEANAEPLREWPHLGPIIFTPPPEGLGHSLNGFRRPKINAPKEPGASVKEIGSI